MSPGRDDAAALVAERLAVRRRRVRTIRRWTVTFAVTLFIAVAGLMTAQSHLVSASSTSGSSSTGGSTGGSASSPAGTDSGTTSSSSSPGSTSSLTTSQS